LRAEQADDSILIESEDALARSHAIQMDSAELERKNTESELETKKALEDARQGINKAKSDEAQFAQLVKKYEKNNNLKRIQIEKFKNDEKQALQRVATVEKKVKEAEQVKVSLSSNLEVQKTKNDELINKIRLLSQRRADLVNEIKSLQRQLTAQNVKRQLHKNRVASLESDLKKLNVRHVETVRVLK
jgi:chromosome segregation ATPase